MATTLKNITTYNDGGGTHLGVRFNNGRYQCYFIIKGHDTHDDIAKGLRVLADNIQNDIEGEI